MWPLITALAVSYLVGSIPTAFLIVRWVKHVDVRTVGSGNVGATNAMRVAGKGAGLAVFLIDLTKGLAVALVVAPWLVQPITPLIRLGCGCMAVIGHSFPIFLLFRGGKGVATTIGVLLGVMPVVALTCLIVWGACFLIWRYVSVASLAAAATIPIAQLLTRQTVPEVRLGVALALLIMVRHGSNIGRLLQGREHRAGKS